VCLVRAARGRPQTDLVVVDASQPLDDATHRSSKRRPPRRIVVANKFDLPPVWSARASCRPRGRDRRRPAPASIGYARKSGRARRRDPARSRDSAAVTNVRHAALLERARRRCARAWSPSRHRRSCRRGIRSDRSARCADGARRSDRQANVRRSAPAHLLAVLYREIVREHA
jgi:hypothetical protein